jgi:hypothetical protein
LLRTADRPILKFNSINYFTEGIHTSHNTCAHTKVRSFGSGTLHFVESRVYDCEGKNCDHERRQNIAFQAQLINFLTHFLMFKVDRSNLLEAFV